jgi:hypothetical protein
MKPSAPGSSRNRHANAAIAATPNPMIAAPDANESLIRLARITMQTKHPISGASGINHTMFDMSNSLPSPR